MLRGLYNWTMRFASGPNALLALIAVSFAESSFFPIPPDVLLVPIILAQRDRAFKIAAWCTAASVAGGIAGYGIGYLLYESVGQWLINVYGYGDKIEQFKLWYQDWGAWIILIKGLTPIPYKLVTIASGIAGYDFFLFVLLSIITRGARFFLEAWLLKRYGEPIREFIEHKLEWVMASIGVTAVIGFVIVKFVV
ncbi:MAG: DedA family protein [Chitinophagales bacterium]|nr:DedA family protein [Hyphomicrobiales bacterium]